LSLVRRFRWPHVGSFERAVFLFFSVHQKTSPNSPFLRARIGGPAASALERSFLERVRCCGGIFPAWRSPRTSLSWRGRPSLCGRASGFSGLWSHVFSRAALVLFRTILFFGTCDPPLQKTEGLSALLRTITRHFPASEALLLVFFLAPKRVWE